MLRQFGQWFFRSRRTGAITIAQAPNLILWIVIAGAALQWTWYPEGRLGAAWKLLSKGVFSFGRPTRFFAGSIHGGGCVLLRTHDNPIMEYPAAEASHQVDDCYAMKA
jgi:hypothetical protein